MVPVCDVLPLRTIEITVMTRVVDTPLVVIELPAHRSEASERVGDDDDGLVDGGRLQCEFGDLLCGDHACASSRVFSTLTPRNNADGQPWLTAAT